MTDDEHSDDPEEQQRCAACKQLSPPTRTAYTLIGRRHGWRVDRIVGTDGTIDLKFYCRACWAARRRR